MDGLRFDGITRALATGTTRRHTLLGVAGSAIAGLLGFTGIEDAAAACIKPGKKGCDGPKDKKCCKGATCQGGSKDKEGRCKCRGSLKQCGSTCVNTQQDEKHCGKCNKKCTGSNRCKSGKCTSKLGCKVGDAICDQTGAVNCPGTTNPACVCITDVEDTHRCSDFTDAFCSTCTSNADCGLGLVCFPANIGQCTCPGNACSVESCDEISGSGAGRGVRPPPLRSAGRHSI